MKSYGSVRTTIGVTQALDTERRLNAIIKAYTVRGSNGYGNDSGASIHLSYDFGSGVKRSANSVSLAGYKNSVGSRDVFSAASERPDFASSTRVHAQADNTVLPTTKIEISKAGLNGVGTVNKQGDILIPVNLGEVSQYGAFLGGTDETTGQALPAGAVEVVNGNLVIHPKILEAALAGSNASSPHRLVLKFANGQIIVGAYKGSVHITEVTLDSPTVLSAPTVTNITLNSFTVEGGIADANGVTNKTYFVYASDPTGNKDTKVITSAPV